MALSLAAAAGLFIPFVPGLLVAGALACAACLWLGLTNWRWSVFGLLVYLPVSGIPIIAMHPDTSFAVIIKDVAFVLPAYCGAVVGAGLGGGLLLPPIGSTLAIAAFTLITLTAGAISAEYSATLALVGLKVWLFYIPLYFLGYNLVSDARGGARVVRLIALCGVVPAVVGLAEAAAMQLGYTELVWSLYGSAARAVTQDYARLALAEGITLMRVPSTFSFVTQHYFFEGAMVAVGYAYWRHGAFNQSPLSPRLALWVLFIAAAVSSGQRGALILIPCLVGLLVALDQGIGWLCLMLLSAAVLALALPQSASDGLAGATVAAAAVGHAEFGDTFIGGISAALKATTLGLGAGVDTNAALRYTGADLRGFDVGAGQWYEGWFVKALIELGLPGTFALMLMLGWLLIPAFRAHWRLGRGKPRALSAALLSLLIWNVVYSVKGQQLDVDPMNVYFWLLAGLLARLPSLPEATGAVAGDSQIGRS